MTAVTHIEIDNLSRTYGRDFAIHRFTARLEAGQLHVLLGPNGAGKSTLLRILATLDSPSSGNISFGSLEFDGMRRQGRGLIGWLAHDSLLYDELSGRENLLFYAGLYGLPASRTEELLEEVAMTEAADRQVRTYSRGMKQRLSLARALLNSPRILLLDEPFSGLDPAGRGMVMSVLAKARAGGALIVLSTHVLELDPELIDRVIVMKRAKLRYFGPADRPLSEIYESVGVEPKRSVEER